MSPEAQTLSQPAPRYALNPAMPVLLRPHGAVQQSAARAASTATTDLVVLSDYSVVDPRMLRDLRAEGIPHLPVRVRDGTGLVGPLVLAIRYGQ